MCTEIKYPKSKRPPKTRDRSGDKLYPNSSGRMIVRHRGQGIALDTCINCQQPAVVYSPYASGNYCSKACSYSHRAKLSHIKREENHEDHSE